VGPKSWTDIVSPRVSKLLGTSDPGLCVDWSPHSLWGLVTPVTVGTGHPSHCGDWSPQSLWGLVTLVPVGNGHPSPCGEWSPRSLSELVHVVVASINNSHKELTVSEL